MDSGVLCWTSVACLACASTVVSADQFSDVKPLFKDLTPGAPGDELSITPVISWLDTDGDNYPDKLKIALNVWDAGTNTKSLQTDKKTVTPPVCALTEFSDDEEIGINFSEASGPSRVDMVMSFEMDCLDSSLIASHPVYKTIWYSADVATGSSYVRTWRDWRVFGTNEVDWDDDGTSELQIILDRENVAGDTTKTRVIYMSYDGTIEADNVYGFEYYAFDKAWEIK